MENKYRRCAWCAGDSLYEKYHDQEWGIPVFDDLKLFEFLTLETFQAGLSWITVLRKRENFRSAFDQFEFEKVALYGNKEINALFNDKGIIRNKQKIIAAVNNAQLFMEIRIKHHSFSEYIWGFVAGKPLPKAISKDLRQNGFQFVGPTVVYAHMQATGMVNDHLIDCFLHKALLQ